MADERIVIEIDFDTSKTAGAFGKVEKVASRSGRDAGRKFSNGLNVSIKKGIGTLGVAFGNLAANLAAQAIQKFAQATKEAFTEIRVFGKAVSEINTLLGKNERITAATTNTFRAFSTEFGTKAQTQAKAFYSVVSAGVKGTAKQLEVLRVANIAATSGLVDIDTSAFALVSSVNAYATSGLTATEASDALFSAVREGQTTFGQLASSIGRVAPIASGIGIKFTELTGTLAFLTKSGISTAESVTGLKAIIAQFLKPSNEAKEAAAELGIQFNGAAIRSKGFVNVLRDIIEKTKGNEDALTKLFPGMEALSAVTAIAKGNFEDFVRILDVSAKSMGITAEQLEKIKEGLDFKTERASSAITNLIGQIGGRFVPEMKVAADSVFHLASIFNLSLTDTVKYNTQLKNTNKEIATLEKLSKRLETASFAASGGQTKEERRAEALADINKKLAEQIKKRERLEQLAFKARTDEAAFFPDEKGGSGDLRRFENDQAIAATKKAEADAKAKADAAALAAEAPPAQEVSFADQALLKQGQESFNENFVEMGKGADAFKDRFKAAGKQINAVMKQVIVKSISNGIQQMVGMLLFGEKGIDLFSKKTLVAMGKMAIQIGEIILATGIGQLALSAGGPAAAIAAGAALIAVGTIVSKLAGGTDALSAPGAGGGGGDFSVQDDFATSEPEIAEPETTVAVTIQGDVLDSDESGTRVVQLINDAFDKDGVVVNSGGVA